MIFDENTRRACFLIGTMLWLLGIATTGALALDFGIEESKRYDVLVYGANAAGVRKDIRNC